MDEIHTCCKFRLEEEESEPPHDKTSKMTFESSEDSDQPRHPPSPISLRCALSG